jgi:hypothetical protein
VEVIEQPIEWPTAEQYAVWARRSSEIREARKIEEPRITNVTTASETVSWMQNALLGRRSSGISYSSSSSYEDSKGSIGGDEVLEMRQAAIETIIPFEDLSFCGKLFKNICHIHKIFSRIHWNCA